MNFTLSILSVLLILCSIETLRLEAQEDSSTQNPTVNDAADGEWITVKRSDFEIVCKEDGVLLPATVTPLSFLVQGKVEFIVPEGTHVQKGDKVISLETKDLETSMQRFQQEVATAEQNLAELEQTRDLGMARLGSEILQEQDRLKVAELREQQILDHPLPFEKEDADNIMQTAQARFASAQADLDALKPLIDKGFGKRADLENKQLVLQKAEIELQRAELKAQMILKGGRAFDREKARLSREKTDEGVKLKEAEIHAQKDSLNSNVSTGADQLKIAKFKLERARREIEHCILLAPHDGIVVYNVIDHRQTKVEVGQFIYSWQSPVELPNYEKMKVKTQVSEAFIRKLTAGTKQHTQQNNAHAGTRARVVIKTSPNHVYHAEVTRINTWARDRNKLLSDADIKVQGLAGVRVFDVEVEIEESDTVHLLDGFRATVEFPVQVLRAVIAIPFRAVTNSIDGSRVQLLQDNKPQFRDIQLGEQSMEHVVVVSGLNENDRIFVPRAKTVSNARPALDHPVNQTDMGIESRRKKRSR